MKHESWKYIIVIWHLITAMTIDKPWTLLTMDTDYGLKDAYYHLYLLNHNIVN